MHKPLPTPIHQHDLSAWTHDHVFDHGNRRGERRTRWVLLVTLLTMAGEIIAGVMTGSMALLADGWHMGTHAVAFGVAALAYALSRRHAQDRRYAFGTWKIEVLGGFSSALVLAIVAVGIVAESSARLWSAQPVSAREALAVAVLGLIVNVFSAWLLHDAHEADEEHEHHHAHHAHGHAHCHPAPRTGTDINLHAAYIHVLADALTSVLAIAALSGALWQGWWWLDPMVGLLGAAVIGIWALGLLKRSAAVLLDREMDHPITAQVRDILESDGDVRIADLHVWRVGRAHFSVVVCIVADAPKTPAHYRAKLAVVKELAHVLIEVNRCPNAPH